MKAITTWTVHIDDWCSKLWNHSLQSLYQSIKDIKTIITLIVHIHGWSIITKDYSSHRSLNTPL